MGFLDSISSFSVNNSIDAQFKTNLAVERVLIAQGKKVGGFTSFLSSLDFIGSILTIVFSLFIIAAILLYHTVLFLIRAYAYFTNTAREEKDTHANMSSKTAYYEDDEITMKLLEEQLRKEHQPLDYDYVSLLTSQLKEDGLLPWEGNLMDDFLLLDDPKFVYDPYYEHLIVAYPDFSFDSDFEIYPTSKTFFQLKKLTKEQVDHMCRQHASIFEIKNLDTAEMGYSEKIYHLGREATIFDCKNREAETLMTIEEITYLLENK